MTDAILEFFSGLPSELYVFVISMLPIVELRGAVPIGAILELPFYLNYPLSVVGNLLPVPFILLFISKLLDFLARFKTFAPMVRWLREKAQKHSKRVLGDGEADGEPTAQKMSRGVFIGLLLFVAIPFPGTGAWTGSLVAAFLDMRLKKALPAVILGVITAGCIMLALTHVGVNLFSGTLA